MADFNRVVEFLRDARQALPQTPGDDLKQAAGEFADLCRQANDRLRQCSLLLQQGLRTEAIASAEESPNLLDLVAALDLPDAQAWIEYCQSYDLPAPPPLQMDRATQLNEAYAADQPLEALMSQHRMLNLQRAPVGERLAVMRQIAAAGAGGPQWEKDLRSFEMARIKELPSAFYNAVKNRDDQTIEALQQEIDGNEWQEPIPEDLRSAVADASQRMRSARVNEELKALVEPLRHAFANGDEGTCAAILNRWQELLASAGVKRASADLQSEVEPVQHFLHTQEERRKKMRKLEASCKKLVSALDKEEPNEVLIALHKQASSYEEPLPEDLERRYQEHFETQRVEVERKARSRRTILIGSVSALVLLLGAAAYIYTNWHTASSWAGRIHAAVAAGDLAAADKTVAEQEARAPQLNSAPVILEAKRERDLLRTQVDHDTQALARIVVADKALADQVGTQVAPETASQDVLDKGYNDLTSALNDQDPALARLDTAGTLRAARAQLDQVRAGIVNRLSAMAKTQANALATQLDAITLPESSSDAAAVVAKIDALSTQLDPLSRIAGLDDDTRKLIADIAERARQKHDAADQSRLQLADLHTLPPASTSSDELTKAIKAFLSRYPGSPLTDDLNKSLAALPAAKSMEAWRDLAAGWNNVYTVTSSDVATKRAADLAAYLQSYPQSPMAAAGTKYQEYLKQAGDALAEKNTWQTGFDELLQEPLIADLATFDTSNGQRYYILGDPKMAEQRINNLRSVTFEAIDPKDLSKRRIISVDPPNKLLSEKPVPVPHAALAAKLSDAIKLIDERNWETVGAGLVDMIVKDNSSELVVRAVLLQQAAKCNDTAYHWAIGDAYDHTIRELARQKPEEIVWYDPDRPISDGTLQALKDIFAAVPKAADINAQIAQAQTDLMASIAFVPATTGVLLHDDTGPSIYAAGPTLAGDTAWAVIPGDSPTTPSTLAKLATNVDAHWKPDPNAPALPQGTLVFVTRK